MYEGQYHAIEISRGSRGFGFSIRGGREFQNMALYVLQIAENGPAAIDGRLKVNEKKSEVIFFQLASHLILDIFDQ